jgi:hypothetical protein
MICKSYASTVSVGLTLLTSLVMVSAAQAEPQNPQAESPPPVVEQQTQEQEPDLVTPILSKLSPETQKLIIRGPNNTFGISGGGENKEAIIKELDQAFDAQSRQEQLAVQKLAPTSAFTVPCVGPLCGGHTEIRKAKADVLDSYIDLESTFAFYGEADSALSLKVTMSGRQDARWHGTKPYNPKFIILSSSVIVDGASVSLSVPLLPGVTVSSSNSGQTATYNSQPFPDFWIAKHDYSEYSATSNLAITGLRQVDNALFRIETTDHQIGTSIQF